MTQTYPFLSEQWFGAVKDLLADGEPELPEPLRGLVVNVNVTDVGVQTTYRGCWFEPGFSDDAEAALTTTSQLAYDVMIEKNLALGVRAIATGKAKLKGDKTKMMKLRAVRPTAAQEAFEQCVREVTRL
ncbi:hypothetical protein A4G26_11115 [Mycobacterium kansasii]|jgi:hypothetical protein|uniref:SCP2 domain-containing protein n=1 Tax=Mycobacterium innocens TaxID=2341083 RepID=A0A498QKC8_9MYCO|nr:MULTISPECIES: hypothetical protein [Mycobacterium]KZS61285.1 hypothetical protein A4G26_11115 [Mycobacterium kansasii]VBA46278.1 hypothetical protein LAUMK13_05638 [Mycobacterium innocens]